MRFGSSSSRLTKLSQLNSANVGCNCWQLRSKDWTGCGIVQCDYNACIDNNTFSNLLLHAHNTSDNMRVSFVKEWNEWNKRRINSQITQIQTESTSLSTEKPFWIELHQALNYRSNAMQLFSFSIHFSYQVRNCLTSAFFSYFHGVYQCVEENGATL